MDKSLSLSLNNLITSFISKKYNMDNVMHTALFSINAFMISKILDLEFSEYSSSYAKINTLYVIICLSIVTLIIVFWKYNKIILFFKKITLKKYSRIKLESSAAIETFTKYIKKYPQIFNLPDAYVISNGLTESADTNLIVRFDDTNLKISGYYLITNEPEDILTLKTDTIKYKNIVSVYLDGNKNINVLNYFSEIDKLVNDPIILYSVKTFRYEKSDSTYASNQHYQIYSGLPYTIDDGYDKHFYDFFHPLKESLLKQIKYVAESEKPAQIGFIFYGPPGTGKSRFAYCLAMALLRHLVSVDVSSLTKSSLQQIFKKPLINEKYTTPNKVIYIFDEFDITINDLNKVEINDEYNEALGRKSLLAYEKKLKFYEEHQYDTDCDGKLAHVEPVPPTVYKSRLLDTNKVTTRSLLEIINGPTPLSGAIFIATTNNFEEIKKICPALFRTGRLTPIYFGYCENETLQNMSNHYYKRELNLPNNIISTISSADIIDYIIKHKLEKDYQFEDFEKFILKNIKTKN